MTDDKLYMGLSASTIMAKQTNHVPRTRLITSSIDKHYSLDSEDDFHSGCRNISYQQQSFLELPSPRRSHYTNYYAVVVGSVKLTMQNLVNHHTNTQGLRRHAPLVTSSMIG